MPCTLKTTWVYVSWDALRLCVDAHSKTHLEKHAVVLERKEVGLLVSVNWWNLVLMLIVITVHVPSSMSFYKVANVCLGRSVRELLGYIYPSISLDLLDTTTGL